MLSDLVERFEDQRYPIQRVSGLDALRHLVESSGKTRATIAAEAGLPESTLSEVLSGRRRLNTRHISILARYFRIDPGVFLDAPAEKDKPVGVGPRPAEWIRIEPTEGEILDMASLSAYRRQAGLAAEL